MREFPPHITVATPPGPNPHSDLKIRVPGSKSLTNRALVIAALANGTSTLTGTLESEDTLLLIDALKRLGFEVAHDTKLRSIVVNGRGGLIPSAAAELFVGNSGTSLRFLTALVCLGNGRYRLDGVTRMRERPVDDLLLALNCLGSNARSELGTGCPPVLVEADGLDGGFAEVGGEVSSQFLSGLLMVLPLARAASSLEVRGTLVSAPYVAMTLAVMNAFGVSIAEKGNRKFNITPQKYQARRYAIEPDASAASYWFAAAAITGGRITIENLGSSSVQGDLAFIDILEHMGCRVERSQRGTTVQGQLLRGVDVDMNAISDTVMTLAVVALFASGMTRIRNVAHIRHKESDRISALAVELRKLGATVEEYDDGLMILPPVRLVPARIETYNDHRMAMAFAIAGLRAEGVTIENPACVSKTYPDFWEDFAIVSRQERM
jgi:3-phosphoshikimate 1-carboxyvinyltransferase